MTDTRDVRALAALVLLPIVGGLVGFAIAQWEYILRLEAVCR